MLDFEESLKIYTVTLRIKLLVLYFFMYTPDIFDV